MKNSLIDLPKIKKMKKLIKRGRAYKERSIPLKTEDLLLDRLRFHGGFYLEDAKHFSACSAPTVRKHMKRLCEKGFAIKDHADHWRIKKD